MIADALKRRLQYQCRRGMLELDVILLPYFEANHEQMDDEAVQRFAALLEEADPDLYTWLMGYGVSDNAQHQQLIEQIRAFKRA